MTKRYRATLGKKAVGIIVVSEKSNELSLGQVFLREIIGKIASGIILGIGYIMAGFTDRKRALHDMVAETVVIYKDTAAGMVVENNPDKKRSGLVIFAIVLACILPFIAIIGILSSIVLVSLSSAKNRANDMAIKSTVASAMPESIIYLNSHGSYNGFQPKISFTPTTDACSGQPIVNISPDGKSMAIFAKLCSAQGRYFCEDSGSNSIEVDETYARSGAAICDPSKATLISRSDNSQEIKKEDSVKNDKLANAFNDDILGYAISYPADWIQQEENDQKAGVTTISLLPNSENPTTTIYIQNTQDTSIITPVSLNAFIKSVEAELIKLKGKIYDEKDFTYTFSDGTTAAGRAFKSEYDDNGTLVKEWLIAVPNGNKLLWFTFVSKLDKYDSDLPTALSILDSWKIKK